MLTSTWRLIMPGDNYGNKTSWQSVNYKLHVINLLNGALMDLLREKLAALPTTILGCSSTTFFSPITRRDTQISTMAPKSRSSPIRHTTHMDSSHICYTRLEFSPLKYVGPCECVATLED